MALHYSLEKKNSVFIGKCVELPAVIVSGRTAAEIEEKLRKAIPSFLDAFPNEKYVLRNQEIKELTTLSV